MSRPVVLIVEDESLVRMLAVDTVESAGCIALEASNAEDAILILEHRTDISLVFTDVHMPGSMDGLKLAYDVRDRWPPVKILIVSGQARLSSADLPSNARFLPKPYSPSIVVAELKSYLVEEFNALQRMICDGG